MSQSNNHWESNDTRTKPMKEPTITMCLPADQFRAMQKELEELREFKFNAINSPSPAFLKDLAMRQVTTPTDPYEKIFGIKPATPESFDGAKRSPIPESNDVRTWWPELAKNYPKSAHEPAGIGEPPYTFDKLTGEKPTTTDTLVDNQLKDWEKETYLRNLKAACDRGETIENTAGNKVWKGDGGYYNSLIRPKPDDHHVWGPNLWEAVSNWMEGMAGWRSRPTEPEALTEAEILAELKLGRRFHIPKKVTIYQHEAEDGIVAEYYLRMGGFDTDFHPWSEVPAFLESITGWKRVSS